MPPTNKAVKGPAANHGSVRAWDDFSALVAAKKKLADITTREEELVERIQALKVSLSRKENISQLAEQYLETGQIAPTAPTEDPKELERLEGMLEVVREARGRQERQVYDETGAARRARHAEGYASLDPLRKRLVEALLVAASAARDCLDHTRRLAAQEVTVGMPEVALPLLRPTAVIGTVTLDRESELREEAREVAYPIIKLVQELQNRGVAVSIPAELNLPAQAKG